ARDDLPDSDRERGRRAAVVGVVEDLAVPDLTEVVGEQEVACLDDLAVTLREHVHGALAEVRRARELELGLLAELPRGGRELVDGDVGGQRRGLARARGIAWRRG